MRLLATMCMVALVTLGQGTLTPGSTVTKNKLLYDMQVELNNFYTEMFPEGSWDSNLVMGINMASGDLCKIKNLRKQKDDSLMVGRQCKNSFSELYNKNENKCSGAFCDTIGWVQDELIGLVESLIIAKNADAVFEIVEGKIYTPLMDWSCKCATDVMSSWMSCKAGIGEAKIWDLIRMSGMMDQQAAYLGGEDFKMFWENVIINEMPWESMNTLLERMMSNLCQKSEDQDKCYGYFYKTVTKLFDWYMNSVSKKEAPTRVQGYPGHCSKFDLTHMTENPTFTGIKDALVSKFCVEECSDLYQDVLLGCCTASMIQDEELERSLVEIAESLKSLYTMIYPEEEQNATGIFEEYFGYAQDAMAMLRNPTCEDSTVQYELRACGEESSEGNTCVQLQSEMMAIKQKMANQCGKITDPCANLEGMKKQKCKREQKNKKDGDNGENEKSGGGGGGRGGGGRGGGGRGGGGRGGGGQGGGRGGGLWKKP